MGGHMNLLAFKDLFARHRALDTGLWRLGREPLRTVFLEGGGIVFATSTHPQDRLTHLMVERGKITQAQLDYAMSNLNPAMSIGKNLIEMGFITQRDLLDVARAQVERVVWSSIAETQENSSFEAKELDANTVRLPFDTSAMLLAGVLNLKDRELVLEELGPLNQVVVLEGRRHQELTFPPDLSRLPDLLDGSRTLMELSRESGVEPFRLGAFVLFLREMGWARLHELPPLDRKALEAALEPPEPIITPPLPEPLTVPNPDLFTAIHASEHPTPQLEPQPEALDQLDAEDELEDTLVLDLTTIPHKDLALPIHHDGEGSTTPKEEATPAPEPTPSTPSRAPLALLAVLVVCGGIWAVISVLKGPRAQVPAPTATTAPAPPKPAAHSPEPTPKAEPERKPEPEPAAPKPVPAAVPSKPEPTTAPSAADRLQAIQQGDMNRAIAQGALQRKALQGRWSLRLEIACQASTIQYAADLLKGRDPDLFIVPMVMLDGRTCYQVYLGSYGSEAAAKEATRSLPPPFHAEGNRPKAFRVAQIPDRQ